MIYYILKFYIICILLFKILISNSYCLPVNGRVIHDIGFLNLENNKYLLYTAGEDTKIKFYYINDNTL